MASWDDPMYAIRNARSLPIYECLINANWQDVALANIILSRRQPDGRIVFGCYLVDKYCLGLKNTFCNARIPTSKYAWLRAGLFETTGSIECPVPLAHSIIYGGIDYAANLGFSPNKDFKLSRYILEERDRFESLPKVEFGKDGKPLFIAGPDDNSALILAQLERSVGQGNFNYIVPLRPDA